MNKKLIALVAACGSLLLGPAAQAAYVLNFEDTVFTVNQLDSDTLTLRIQHALSSTGTWANATRLDNIALKGLGASFTGGTITGPGSWSFSANEMTASGCSGGDSGGVCFDATPAINISDDMEFRIDLTGGTLAIDAALGPHLKLRFLGDQDDKKVGSLLSQSLPGPVVLPAGPDGGRSSVDSNSNSSINNVPEPSSALLASLALLAALGTRRRSN